MKKFLTKLTLFCTPLLLLVLSYFILDPYKVLYEYDRYTPENGTPMYVTLNRSMVSTKNYIRNNPKYHYDSFIFGSSRSGYFRIFDWKKHIGDSTSCFLFNEFGGRIYVIHKKIKFIDQYSDIKNALLCLDDHVLRSANAPTGPIYMCPPELKSNEGWLKYQMLYFRTYFSPEFCFPYLIWLAAHNLHINMKTPSIIDDTPYYINTMTNEEGINDSIRYGIGYVATDEALLAERPSDPPCHPDYIKDRQLQMLTEIRDIFEKHNTNYKIVINPSFDQRKLSPHDMDILYSLFGSHLYDFSGKNEITDNPDNYLDTGHFNSAMAKKMMDIMYSQEGTPDHSPLEKAQD